MVERRVREFWLGNAELACDAVPRILAITH
jgi:hypothetical protein